MQKQDKIVMNGRSCKLIFESNGNSVYLTELKVGSKVLHAPQNKSIAFHQIQTAGGDRDAHHGAKHLAAGESSVAEFEQYQAFQIEDGMEYCITTHTKRLKIQTYFRFYHKLNTFRVYNSVTNISEEDICLEEVNALLLGGLGCEGNKNKRDCLFLYIPHNSWHTEVQWQKYSLRELGLFNGNNNTNLKRINVNNTGSWSTKEYLPMGILENEENHTFLLWQIEANGSWHYELGDFENEVYLNVGGPNFTDNFWAKRLAPNETFVGVPAAFAVGRSLNDVLGEITMYRRKIRRQNKDNENLPIIFNSYMHAFWDYPDEVAIRPLINKAAELGCEYFCIDAGWHDEEDWWGTIGEWKESHTRFPSGVKQTIDYIHEMGMKAGLWLEIESVGARSALLPKLRRGQLLERGGRPALDHGRYGLDFSDAGVRKYADSVIDRMMGYGIDYIKIDYNVDIGPGTDYCSDSLGDGLLRHNRAYLDWLRGVYNRYPDLVIENCASGGCRMDYAMLSLHSIQSTSDQTDYKKYPYIAANAVSAVCPEQSAVWSYPLADWEDKTSLTKETVIFNMVNCMLGRMHLASRLDKLGEDLLSAVREGITYYNNIRGMKKNSVPYLPLGFAAFGDTLAASGLRCGSRILLAVWNLNGAREVEISLPQIRAEKVSLGYPAVSSVEYSWTENSLRILFGEDWQAQIFEINASINDTTNPQRKD